MNESICEDFKQNMCRKYKRGIIFCCEDKIFNIKRKVFNARFNPDSEAEQPIIVAECQEADEVVDCIEFAKKHDIALKVKSGGHNHAGWSTGKGTLVIHLANNINDIDITSDSKAWVYPGSRLGNVYKALQNKGKTIPGGVCKFVNVGGLTQGGGWGLSVRKFGLTIDSLVEAEIVVAGNKGEKAHTLKVNAHENNELFWAIRGGGGGNFGVVTKFLFNLSDIGNKVHIFRINWSKDQMAEVIKAWVKFHNANQHHDLSSFLRLSVTGEPKTAAYNATEIECDSAVLMVGMYYGTKPDLMDILKKHFFNYAHPICEQYRHTNCQTAQSLLMGFADDSQMDSENTEHEKTDFSFSLHFGDEAHETPKPHKVTSAFPTDNFGDDAIRALSNFVQESHVFDKARTYISLHALGGKVAKLSNKDTAFAFRQKKFMLQAQAWWKDKNDKHADKYMCWIEKARFTLKSYTKGAFVNFPDLDVPVAEYYGENFKLLKKIKLKYDPDNHFNYPGSIPPEGK